MISEKTKRYNYMIKEAGAEYFIDRYNSPKEKPYYSGCVKVRDKEGVDKWIPVKEGRWEYWPNENLLGFTDLKEIHLRPDLGYWHDRVLKHEMAHIEDPDVPEHVIRDRTKTRDLLSFYRN